MDRSWYQREDGMVDDTHTPFIGDEEKFLEVEREFDERREADKKGIPFKKRKSQRAHQLESDNTRWEENRLVVSGVVAALKFDLDVDDEAVCVQCMCNVPRATVTDVLSYTRLHF